VLSDRTVEYRVSATHLELGIHLADLLDGANHYFNEVLDAAGAEVVPALWSFLAGQSEILDDEDLLAGLATSQFFGEYLQRSITKSTKPDIMRQYILE
jgi:hypothetical protein